MIDVVAQIFGQSVPEEIVYQVCGVLLPVLTVTFIDVIYRIFRHFWR